MWGGPSHLDTFDPKPEAGNDYCGPLDKPIATNVDGIRIGELLPLLAKQADKYSIIRSMTHGVNGHETASYMVQTGRQPGGRLRLPVRRRRGLAVQGLRRRLQGPDPALHRADPAAGAVLRGRLPRAALQAVRHRRRPGQDAASSSRASSPRASPTSDSRAAASCSHKLDTLGQRHARRPATSSSFDAVRGEGLRPDPRRRRQGVRPRRRRRTSCASDTAATRSASPA